MTDEDFTAFFRREFPRLVLHVALRAGPQHATDAAQESMGEALRQWKQIGNPEAWVRTVAVRIAHDKARSESSRITRETTYTQRIPVRTADPLEHAEITEEQEIVLKRLREMPEIRRKVVALIFDGLTTQEISTQLGMAEATVRSHLRHARRSLSSGPDTREGGAS